MSCQRTFWGVFRVWLVWKDARLVSKAAQGPVHLYVFCPFAFLLCFDFLFFCFIFCFFPCFITFVFFLSSINNNNKKWDILKKKQRDFRRLKDSCRIHYFDPHTIQPPKKLVTNFNLCNVVVYVHCCSKYNGIKFINISGECRKNKVLFFFHSSGHQRTKGLTYLGSISWHICTIGCVNKLAKYSNMQCLTPKSCAWISWICLLKGMLGIWGVPAVFNYCSCTTKEYPEFVWLTFRVPSQLSNAVEFPSCGSPTV